MLPSLDLELHTPARRPFITKLRNFLEDHGFDNVPTLVLQCAAQDAQVADLDSRQLAHALLNGAGQSSAGDWWAGFAGGDTFKVFDGLASKGDTDEPHWATELHHDGHVIAAVRLLVYRDTEGVHPAIHNAFPQFGLLVQKLHAAAGVETMLTFTATLINGKGLALVTFPQYGNTRVRKLGRDILEWPVLVADATDDIGDVCLKLQARLQRAFP